MKKYLLLLLVVTSCASCDKATDRRKISGDYGTLGMGEVSYANRIPDEGSLAFGRIRFFVKGDTSNKQGKYSTKNITDTCTVDYGGVSFGNINNLIAGDSKYSLSKYYPIFYKHSSNKPSNISGLNGLFAVGLKTYGTLPFIKYYCRHRAGYYSSMNGKLDFEVPRIGENTKTYFGDIDVYINIAEQDSKTIVEDNIDITYAEFKKIVPEIETKRLTLEKSIIRDSK